MARKQTSGTLEQRNAELENKANKKDQFKKSLGLYSEILENMAEGVCLVRSKDGIIVYTNRIFEKMFGYGQGELITNHVSIVNSSLHNNPEETASKIIMELKKSSKWSGQVHNIKKDGTPFWTKANVSTFAHAEIGEVWLSVHEDITERVQKEAEMFEKTQYAARIGFFNWDLKTDKVHLSDETCHLFGIDPGDIHKIDSFMAIVHPSDFDLVKENIALSKKGIKEYNITHRLLHPNGEVIWVKAQADLCRDSNGNPEYLLVTLTDIGAIEETLRKKEIDLESKSKRLEETNIALKVLLRQNERDKRELEEMVVTNIKSQIIPFIEKLKKMGPNSQQRTYLEILELNVNDITSPLLRQLSSKYINLTPQEIQVATFVRGGKTTKEIAEILNISPHSVHFHRKRIRKKLGLHEKKANLRSHLLFLE